MRRGLTWVIFGAVLGVALFAGVDALRSSLHGSPSAVEAAPTVTRPNVSSRPVPYCKRNQMTVAIEVRKPDETRAPWNQRQAPGWQAWQRTPVATLVTRNVGANRCFLLHSIFHLGIKDRDNDSMARWHGPQEFHGLYEPDQERTFSLPNVFSCDRPGPFSAIGNVGGHSARLDGLAYDEVTCTSGRHTPS